jgi:hypothetical protein
MRPRDTQKPLTAERLREVVRYEQETGKFYWLKGNNQKNAGDEAGSRENTGYIRVTIDGHRYVAHRLAWLYMTESWPVDRIDHRNRTRDDNRWENLRQATDSQNKANQKAPKNNMLGVKGVRLHECGKYIARVCKEGQSVYLGVFDTLEAAKAAYEEKSKEMFGNFARTG